MTKNAALMSGQLFKELSNGLITFPATIAFGVIKNLEWIKQNTDFSTRLFLTENVTEHLLTIWMYFQ